MIIRNDHIFLKSAQHIREITNPLLSCGVNYFSYGRHYHDGGRIWLCNTPENVTNYYNNKLYRSGNSEAHPKSYKTQVVLWSTLPNQNVFEFLKQRGTSNGIFVIESQKDYCEFTAFGINRENNNAVNTFLTNLELLKRFRDHFKEKATQIIKQAEANQIYLPYHNKTIEHANNLNHFTTLECVNPIIKLSPRQYSCAKQLLEGKTTKEIADTLSLSSRTVESYINTLKLKLNCDNKTQLIMNLIKILKYNA